MAAGHPSHGHKPKPLGTPGKLLQALLTLLLLATARLCIWMGPDRMARIGGHSLPPRLIGGLVRPLLNWRSPLGADANLKRVFPDLSDAERDAIKRSYYSNMFRSLTTTVSFKADEQLFSRIEVCGLEHLQGHANGIIFVSCHFYDWEIGWLNLFRMGYPPYILYRDYSENLLDYRTVNGRNRYSDPDWYIPTWRSGELVERSSEGKNLFLFVDVRTKQGRNGALIDFCGHPAWTSTFAAKLALAHGKALVPVYFRPDGQGDYLQYFESPIDCSSGDPVEITRLINASMAGQIMAHPDQWALWNSVRWNP
jgi:KDO2-lipid IV(A) lauroyltransferase